MSWVTSVFRWPTALRGGVFTGSRTISEALTHSQMNLSELCSFSINSNGSISLPNSEYFGNGIYNNSGTIATLNNKQGAGGSASRYAGGLPRAQLKIC